MDPLTAAVLTAIGTAASGALSGATGEVGRRSAERLLALVRRTPTPTAAPDTEEDPGATAEETPAAGPADRSPRASRAHGAPNSRARAARTPRTHDEQTSRTRDEPTSPADREHLPVLLPADERERIALAVRLREHADASPDFARELTRWAHETAWLAPRTVPALAHTASAPQMLRPAPAAFTDREHVVAEIAGLLAGHTGPSGDDGPSGSPLVVVLTGPGGIGKSATALHCAHLLKSSFPDGQLYADLGGGPGAAAVSPSDVLTRFLDRLGVPPDRMPADPLRLADLYRDCTADRRMLVVLDDAVSDAQVEPLLPAGGASLVLVTGRRLPLGLVAAGARPLTLPPLSAADSLALLGRIAGPERMTGAERPARAVAERCGGLPLALCTTGARVAARRHLTWDTVERQMSGHPGGAGNSGESDGPDHRTPYEAVHAANEATYRELSPPCAALYRALGVWPWPSITVGAAARAAGTTEGAARVLLEELAAVHLLEEVGEERYRFHDLVREHARRRAESEDGPTAMTAAVRRTVSWHLGLAAQADHRVIPSRWRLGPAYRRLTLPPDRDPGDARTALRELRDERENLAAAVRAAEHHGFDELVWQLCEAMWGLHLRLGFHAQWIASHRSGVEAARRCAAEFGDPRAEGRMLVQLGFAHMGLGQVHEAEEALTAAARAEERAGHHRGQASAVEALGLLRLRRLSHDRAQRCFEQAQTVLRRMGPDDDGVQDLPRALALLDHHIGRALRGRGRHAEAVTRLNEALVRFRALPGGDLYNEGRVYMSLGETRLDAGEPDLARVCLDRAVAVMTAEGADLQLADALELRARCASDLGDHPRRTDDLRAAAALYEKTGDAVAVARVRALAEAPEEADGPA